MQKRLTPGVLDVVERMRKRYLFEAPAEPVEHPFHITPLSPLR